jgi:hypothetical protein
LFLCDFDQKKNMAICARTGEEEWTMRGSSGAYGVVEIDDEWPRVCGTPVSYSGSLGARFGEGRRGGWRGDAVLLIGISQGLNGRGIKGIKGGEEILPAGSAWE